LAAADGVLLHSAVGMLQKASCGELLLPLRHTYVVDSFLVQHIVPAGLLLSAHLLLLLLQPFSMFAAVSAPTPS
jgi:hypothetical protein